MGQKTNPNIFRLGVNKIWKTEFFEKKNRELPLYIFKDLEIQHYLKRFLELQGIYLHNYKQYYNNSTLHLYISYFLFTEFISKEKNKTEKSLLIIDSYKKKKIFNKVEKISESNHLNANLLDKNKLISATNFYCNNAYILKKYLNKDTQNLNKYFIDSSPELFISNRKGLLVAFLKILNVFINKNVEVIIHWSCLNKHFTHYKQFEKKKFILFQKFERTPFLKIGLELMFHVVCNKDSANLLASFIATNIKRIKRHKFFLVFLKQVLNVLISSNLSQIQGLKIIIKGRLNGASRARHKILTIGKTPINSFKTKLDYCQTSTHNSDGSYGIKVWISEKN